MIKKLTLLLTLLAGALTSAFAGPYDTWSNYKTITVNTGNAVNDTNYPELVRLTNSSAATGSDILSGSLTAGGLDVVFTDSTGQTAYKFERERFTSTNGEFWVRLPMLWAGQNTRFRVYWGKSAATDLTNGAGVWDTTSTLSATPGNAYRAVWHMNGTGATETDVTANHWQLLSGGLASPPTNMIPTAQVASPIAFGRNFNATNSVLSPSGFSTPNGMYFLNSVQGNSAGTGWAVGNLGTILKTTDGGNTWTAQTSNTVQNLRAVYFTDANHGIAVGDSGTIDTTASGGANWSLVADPYLGVSAGIGFYTVAFIDTLGAGTTSPMSLQTGYIGGDDGTLTRITNFGTPASAAYTTISTATSTLSPTLSVRGIACDINTCLIVGDSGQSKSIWGLQSTITYKAGAGLSTSFNLVGATYTGHPGLFFAAGDSAGTAGVIYKIFNPNSATAITVTKFVPKFPGFPPNGTVGFPPLKAIAAGVPDSVLAGQGAVGGGGFYYGAQSVAAWAVGNNGTIVRTMNTGTSWGLYPSGTSNNLTCVSVPFGATTKFASDFGWAGGASGTLLTAGNFGQWFSVNTGTTTAYSAGAYSTIKNQLNFVDSSAYTITTWVNQRNYDNDVHNITTKGDQFYVLQEDAGQHYNAAVYYSGFQNWYGQNASNHGVTENLNAWHYLAMTRINPVATAANTQIWLDGVNIDSANGTPGTISQTPNATLSIGRTLDGGNAGDSLRFFPGTLSHMTFASVGRNASWLGADFATQSASQTAVTEAGTAGVPIVVTTQPANDTVTSGSATSLTVVATGGGGAISYKWYKNGAAMTDGGDVTGSGTATLSFSSVSGGDPAVYKCALVNQVGDSSFTNNASLVIASTPGFTGYASPKSYVAGQPIAANDPVVTGNPSTCTSVPTLPTGLVVSNATCVISGTPTVGTATATYTITAHNIAGTTPTTVSITVYDTVPSFTSQPAGKTTAAVGATAKIGAAIGSALGGDVAVTYLWQRLRKNLVLDTPQVHSGVTSLSDTLSVGPITAADDSSLIRVLVSNTAGIDTSKYDTLRVTPFILHASASVTYGRNNGIVDTDASTNTGGPITSCSVSPTLPAGLVVTLNPSVLSCAITGTPTAWAVPAKFGITATGPGGTSPFDSVTVTVLNKATAMTYGPSSVTYEEGQRIIPNTPFVADSVPQTPFSYSLVSGSLPPGLSLNSATGAITGTVSTGDAGSSPYVDSIIAFNVADTVGFKLTMNVFAPETYTSGSHADFTLDTRSTAGNVVTSQANFPVLVRLNLAHKSILVNDSTGIRFTNASGLHLPYQIAHWSYTGGDTSAAIWVSPDTVYGSSSAGTTTIRMYYNTGLSTSRSNGANVFGRGNGHLAVWHMNEASGNAADASGSGFNAVVGGAAPGAASGAPLPGGRSFNGSTQDFYAPTVGTISSATYFEFGLGNSYAVSTWASDNVTGSVQGMISHGNQDWQLQIQRGSGNKGYEWSEWSSTSTFQNADENVAHTDLNWHYVVGIKNPASPYLQIYVDGVLQTSNSTSNDNTTGAGPKTGGNATFGLVLGAYSNGVQGTPTAANDFFTGSMVESRVLNKNVTGDWVRLNYLTQRATANPITNLSYSNASPSFVNGVAITTDSPSVVGSATRYTISNGSTVTDSTSFHSVTGLTFTTASGKITGTPNATLSNSPFTVTAYGDSAWSTTSNLSITVNSLPAIVSNPATRQSVVVGGTAKLGVTVTGTTPLIFAWTHSHGGVVDTIHKDTSSSALTDTLILASVPPADTGTFNVTVSNSIGSVTSGPDTLTVTPATFIYPTPVAIYGKRVPIATDSPSVTGAVAKFTVTPALPSGLVLDSVTGKIFGTPTAATTVDTLVVTGTNGPLSSSDTLRFTVNGFSYVTNHPALFGKNSPVAPDSLKSVVGTFTHFTVSPALPSGVSLDSSVGVISGTPTVSAAAAKYAVTGNYSGGTAVDTLDLTVLGFAYATQPVVFINGSAITPDSVHVAVGPLTHFTVSPALASGLALDTNLGVITGTPTATLSATNYVVTASDSGKASTVDTLNITVNTVPVIASNPAGQSANIGTTVKFGVSVTSGATTPLMYAWIHSHGGATDTIQKDTLSVLTDTLTLASIPQADTGTYKVVVSNVGGSTTSTSATLIVNVPPTIASNPLSQSSNVGGTVKFGVSVTSGATTPLTYAWLHVHGGATDTVHKDTLSVLTDSLTLASIPLADTGSYKAVVSNVAGSVTSTSATLSLGAPPAVTSSPASKIRRAGVTTKFGVTVTGATPLTYAWVHNHGGTADTLHKDTLSVLTDSLTTETLLATDTGSYLVVVSNASGTVTSASASLSIITSEPANVTAVAATAVKFGVTVVGSGPFTYQWVHSHGGSNDTIGGQTTDTLTLASVAITDTGTYKAVVTNSVATATSTSATLVVNVPPVVASSPAAQTVLVGTTVKLGVSVTSGATLPLTYKWIHVHGGVTDTVQSDLNLSVLTDTLTLASAPLADTGTYAAVISNAGGSVSSSSALLSLVSTPVATPPSNAFFGSISVSLATSSGAAIRYTTDGSTPTGSSTLYTTSLSFNATTTLKAIAILNAVQSSVMSETYTLSTVATPTASVPSQAFTSTIKVALAVSGGAAIHYTTNGATPDSNSTLYVDTLTFSTTTTLKAIAVLSGSVSGVLSQTYSLNTPPSITTQPHDTTVLAGANASFTVAATAPGTLSYQWRKNGTPIGGATSSSLNLTSVSTSDTASYSVVITDSLGTTATSTTSGTGKLILNLAPVISVQPAPLTKTVGSAAAFSVSASGAGQLGYQWKKNGSNLSNAGTVSGVTTATLNNSSVAAGDTGTYSVVVTDTLNGTVSSTTSSGALLTLNSGPAITTQPTALTKLVGASASFTVVASGPTGSHLGYQWQKNGVNLSNVGTLSGVTTATLSNTAVAATDTGTYSVFVTDTLSGTVSSTTSSGAYLTVNTAPVITTQPVAQTKTLGASASFTVVATGPTGGHLGYQWQKNGSNLSNAGTLSGVTTATLSNSAVAAGDTGTYAVIVTDSLGGTVSSTTSSGAALTLNSAATITTQPAAQTKLVGASATFTVVATGPTGGHLGYQWQKNGVALSNAGTLSGVTTATLSNSAVAATDTGTYTVIVTDTLSGTVSSVTSSGAFLTVNTAPVISTQPAALTKTVGAIASFTVVATGPTGGHLGYQWQKNGVALSNGVSLTGVTTATLRDSVAATDTGTYAVIVTDSLGGTVSSTTSSGAFLTVNAAPVITTQPVALTKTIGASASFTVVATGSGTLSYQWQKNGSNLSNAGTVSGVTTATLSNSAVAAGDTGTYTVIVTNTLNATTASTTSAGAFLTLNSAPVISTQPAALTKLVGASAAFTVVATGPTGGHLGYQWQKNGVALSNAGTLSGVTTATLSNSAVAATDTGTYAVVVTDTLGGTVSSTTSSGAFLTVNTAPVISTQPAAQTKAVGSIGTFTVVATGPTGGHLGYQWQKNGLNLSNGVSLTGVTTATLRDSVAATDTGTYAVVVTDSLGGTVSSTTSSGAFLTVNTAAVISTQPVALTKLVGASASFTVVATGPTGGHLGYQWQKNSVNLSNAGTLSGVTTATLSNSAVAATDTGTYKVIVTDTLNGTVSTVTSSGAFLTINTAPVISTQPAAVTKAVATAASFTVVATGPTGGHLGYQWQKNGVNLSNAGTLSGVTTATLSNSSVAATDTGTYSVIVTDSLGGTVSSTTSSGAFLTVNTAPVITTQPVALTKTVGSIATFTVVATGPTGGHLGYQWQKNGVNLSSSVSLTGVATATLRDSVAATDTGTYTVIVTDSLGGTVSAVTSSGAFLAVNTAPVISTQPLALTKTVGSIATFTVVATGPTGGHLGYQWQKNGVALSSSASLTGVTTATLRDSVAAADTGTYSVIVTDSLGGTTAAITSSGAFLTVNTAPVISTQPVALSKTVGTIATFTVVATGPTGGHLGYQWLKNGVALSNSASLTGVTTATLRDSAAASDSGTYTVLVTDSLGGTVSSTLSSGAYLTVGAPPVITVQPVSVKIAAGSGTTFSVTASGGVAPLTYQWFNGATALTDTTGLAGSKTATLTLTNVSGPDSGRSVANMTVVVSSAGTAGSVTSGVATLTVNALPKITTQPISSNANIGQTVTFTVAATKGVGPLVYQWFKGGTPMTDSTGKVSGSKTATLTLTNIASTDTGSSLYYVVVANVDTIGYATSNSVSIQPPTALFTNIGKAMAIRTMGSSVLFQLPTGVSSAQITLLDVWGRPVWSRTLGHGINQVTWNGNSASGSRATGAGLYIIRMTLFDAQQHQVGILQRKFSYTP